MRHSLSSCRFAVVLLAAARFAVVLLAAAVAGCATAPLADLPGTPSVSTARAALSGGSPEVALRICDGLAVREPLNAGALVCRGDALSVMGRNAEAAPAYEQALRVDPHAAAADIGLGRIALQTDAARAEALFLKALTEEPRNAVALNDLGIARDLQGRHADAQTAYGEAIAAAPENRAAQVNLALSLAMSGQPGEAIRCLRWTARKRRRSSCCAPTWMVRRPTRRWRGTARCSHGDASARWVAA
jgi:tetratricopeptide (TPR) repeat protein